MRLLHSLLVLTTAALPATGQCQWPQYLGPSGDATSQETGLVDAWPADGPPERWRIEVGPGFGGAAVVDNEVFLLDRVMGQADALRVLDLNTGQEKWRYRYDAPGRVGYEGSRCTPAVTDTRIFTTGQFGHLYAFDRKSRKVAWSVNLMQAYPDADGDDDQKWGYGMNPLVVGSVVIAATPASEAPGLVAFDQAEGKVVWASEPFGDANMYSSPILRTIAGQRGIVVRTIKTLYFIDPETGRTLFEYTCYDKGKIPITPVTVMPDGEHVFVTQGYDMGSVMLRVTRDGGGFKVQEQYRTIEGSQIHPGIVVGEHLYINHTENSTARGARQKFSGLACVEAATGKVLWNTGTDPFIGRGATLLAQGRFIVQDSETGWVYLVQPSPEGFKPVSKFKATDAKQKKAWGPLTLADGRLILRDQDEMACYDLRNP